MNNEKGFSLISVIVAMVLLAFGLTALVRSSTYSAGVRHGASARFTATYIAETYLEKVKMWPDSLIVAETATRVDSEGTPDAGGAFVRSMTVDRSIATDLVKTTVTVEYPWALGGRRSVDLVTLFYKGTL